MVPAYERKISKTQYVYESVILRKILANALTNKFSKKYTFYGLNSTFETATNLMQNCILANECNVIEEYDKRKNYLKNALHYINLLSIEFECILEYKNELKEGTINIIFDKLEKIPKLIKGILNSDKQRYQQYLGG